MTDTVLHILEPDTPDAVGGVDPLLVIDEMGESFGVSSVDDVWRTVIDALARAFPGSACDAVEFVGDERVRRRHAIGFARPEHPLLLLPSAPNSQTSFVRSSPHAVVSSDLRDELRFVPSSWISGAGLRSSMSVSCELPDGGHGIIGVHSSSPSAFDGDDLFLVRAAAGILSRAIAVVKRRCELEVASTVDPLTGLMSRSAIIDVLTDRLDEQRRTKVLFLDLDAFADVNARHGHVLADQVLEHLARRFEHASGLGAKVGRLGSDEFMIVGDHDDVAETTRLAEILAGHVEQMVLIGSASLEVSASIGVAICRHDDTVGSIMARADSLMLEAKSAGRGRVRVEQPESTPADPRPPTRRPHAPPPVGPDDLDDAIAGVRVVFQEIVNAHDETIFGVEALTRGPAGHPLEYPDRLFSTATTFGRLGDLELAAKKAAFDAPLPDAVPLFVNIEPSLLGDSTWLSRLADLWERSTCRRPIVAEITERAVMVEPGRLLDAVDACRSLGWALALDDVGARSESLAALRLVRPDIVKLDMGLIRSDNRAHAAHVGAAVASYREEHHCSVVAEGIESQRDRDLAHVLGADLLQGYLFGRPAPADGHDVWLVGSSPARPLAAWRTGRKDDLLHISRYVESLVTTPDAVILTTVQNGRHFTTRTRRQYVTLARRCGFVGVLGEDLREHEGESPGVRLGDLCSSDPLRREWNVVILSPTKSLALLAAEVESDEPVERDGDRLFRYRLVSDLVEVETAARRLMRYF